MTSRRPRRSSSPRDLYRLIHAYYLGRAIIRGPKYLAGYMLRRAARRAAFRATRNWR